MSARLKAALLWAASGDTGLSSEAILSAALGRIPPSPYYPSDTGDLGRCLRLLAAWPGARIGIKRLADICPVWREIDRDWRRLTAAARDEGVAERRAMMGSPDHTITTTLLKRAIARGEAEQRRGA